MAHHYRITVEALDGPAGHPTGAQLRFEAANHDDLLRIAGRVRQRGLVPDHEAASLAIGTKLLGEVVLAHRRAPLFAELAPAMGAYMRRLKGPRRSPRAPGPPDTAG